MSTSIPYNKSARPLLLFLWMLLTLLICTFLINQTAHAHAEGEDYVFVNFLKDRIEGEFQVNYSDLKEKLDIHIPDDETAAMATVAQNTSIVHDYIKKNFSITPQGGSPYQFKFSQPELFEEASEYVRFPFVINSGPVANQLQINHNMYYQNDPTHRGLFLVQYNAKTDTDYGPEYTALIFSPNNRQQTLDLSKIPGLIEKNQMVFQGMLHIWKGLDHILFLLALLLPTVLVRQSAHWNPVERPAPAVKSLLTIITVFTVAHSVTLLLAALDFLSINSRLVESVIALSIIIVALNNIFQWITRGSLLTILVLGLFHGLGFATVMGNLPFRMVDLVSMVIRFNIGVEIGQVIIVALLFPVLYLLRKQQIYVPLILKGGSWLLIAIASYWFVQRAFGIG